MSDKGIIFSAPMVRALLDGRKTQTRRLIKGAPQGDWHCDRGAVGLRWVAGPGSPSMPCVMQNHAGDRLWVREGHYITDDGWSEYAVYACDADAVDEHHHRLTLLPTGFPQEVISQHRRLRPSIHMPRWASRLWLATTDVRVQRLQDCSEADAIAEGVCVIAPPEKDGWRHFGVPGTDIDRPTPTKAYAALWNSLHTAEGTTWEANPWVCAVSFTCHHGNIDAEAAHG